MRTPTQAQIIEAQNQAAFLETLAATAYLPEGEGPVLRNAAGRIRRWLRRHTASETKEEQSDAAL